MDAPRCRLCGKSHWGGCNSKNLPDVDASPNRPRPSPNTETAESPPSPNGYTRNRRWRERHPDHYRAYMRDYMRRWRVE